MERGREGGREGGRDEGREGGREGAKKRRDGGRGIQYEFLLHNWMCSIASMKVKLNET